MLKHALTVLAGFALGIAMFGQAAAATVDANDIKRQQRTLASGIVQQKQTLSRVKTRAEVTRAARAASQQFDAFARTFTEMSADDLTALFLKLNISDPNNSPETHNALQKEAARLRAQAQAMAHAAQEAAKEKAKEAKEADEADLAEAAAEAVEEIIEQAEDTVETILGLLGF